MKLLKYQLLSISLLFFSVAWTQKVSVNTVGKDPFNGKANDVVYKSPEGEWSFAYFGDSVIKTTFKPVGYTRNEQISDAVSARPLAANTKITSGPSQTIEFESLVGVVIQRDKLYYKNGKEVKIKAASYFESGESRGFRFQLTDNEKFFGGGERALPMDRRGYRFNLYNSPSYGYGYGADNLNFSVPIIISSNGYAIFFDNPSRGYMDIGLTDKNTLESAFVSGELSFYTVFGKNLDDILNNYTSVTGRQPLPARWVFGNFVSRFGYTSEKQVKDVVAAMREAKFPMDGLIFDLFWFGDSIKGTLGNLDWVNTQKWPNPKQMIADLRTKESLKTVLITEPFILNGTKTYTESLPFLSTDKDGKPFTLTDLYFGNGGLVDIFRKQSQDFLWKYYKKQIANGVAGWWIDLAEPEKHPVEIHHNLKDYGVQRLLNADEVHNAYGHYWSKMLFEKYDKEYSDTRLFHLNRAGFAGSQRYGIFPWTGDVARNWGGLKSQLPILLGMSLSGLPYIHSDAGGFAMTDEKDGELYTRWLQFAAFTPVFRPHGTALETLDPNVKSIPSEPCFWEEPFKSLTRQSINMRYRLLPYNYTLAYEQSVNGKPLMRPMYYYNFADAEAIKAEDQYYWGDNFLVAPVVNKGASSRTVYLPEGQWYNFNTNKIVAGNRSLDEPVDINSIPIFVKEGSFIPMWSPAEEIRSTEQYDSKNITIRYYPSAKASRYQWFDDDGTTTKTLEKAQYEVMSFSGQQEYSRISITIATNNDPAYRRKFMRKINLAIPYSDALPKEVKVNGTAVTDIKSGTEGSDQLKFFYVPIEFAGKTMKIEMLLK